MKIKNYIYFFGKNSIKKVFYFDILFNIDSAANKRVHNDITVKWL